MLRSMMVWLLPIVLAMVVASSCGGSVHRTSWRLDAPPSSNELRIKVLVAGCDSIDLISVSETESTVRIAAYVRSHNRGSACPSVLGLEARAVQLRTPLGDRSLEGCNSSSAVYEWPDLRNSDCSAFVSFPTEAP